MTADILIVDDHQSNLVALEAILEPLGHRLIRANSGQEALKCLLTHEFAVIVMDVQMPGMDGYETASLIKTREKSRHIPIIFLTAINRDRAHVFMGYAHGAVDYLLKPFDPSILRSKVSVFIELFLRGERIKAQERALGEQRQAHRFREVLDGLPQCVWAAHPDGTMYYCNKAGLRYSGLVPHEAICDRVWEIVHLDDVVGIKEDWAQAVQFQRPFHREVRLLRAFDHAYRWHHAVGVPERDQSGHVIGWILTASDIDDLKSAREQAEQASRTKDLFLATVSHELRNPLNAIVGWTQMLRSGKVSTKDVDRALGTIERNADAQTALIEDILDISRISAGKLRIRLDNIDIGSVLSSAVDTVRPTAEAKSVKIVCDLEDAKPMAGDPDRLRQIFWNLLSNAIRFTPSGGTVTASFHCEGEVARITVTDTGQGIRPDFLPFIFDRFRQEDAGSKRSHGGLGLGLAIVRHLVELHGGTVSASSPGENQGATLQVELPIRQVEARDQEEEPAPIARDRERRDLRKVPSLDGLRVVLVDDDPDVRELIALVLENNGAEVSAAGSADEAIELLRRIHPDVLLSDIGMPKRDGFDLLRQIRDEPEFEGMPVIALTGFAQPEDGRRALAEGFNEVLSKPVEPSVLLAKLNSYERSHRPAAAATPI